MKEIINKVLHLSHVKSFEDGGIYTSVKKIIESESELDISTDWISTKNINNKKLINFINQINPNMIHIHGLWRLSTRNSIVNNLSAPLIISPHGMLSDWALKQSFLKKKIALRLWENNSLKKAKSIHALSKREIQDIKSILPNSKVAYIPNCINNKFEKLEKYPRNILLEKIGFDKLGISQNDKILLYLGRFHKGKNVDLIVKAWVEMRKFVKDNNWHLCLVGDGNEKSKIMNLSRGYPFKEFNWHISHPLFDEEKYCAYYSSNGFILSSNSEAMPMSTLEAMSTGLTCLISRETNLLIELSLNLAIETQPTKTSIIESIKELINLSSSKEKKLSSDRIKSHIKSNYNHNLISEKYLQLYNWTCLDSKEPDFIY